MDLMEIDLSKQEQEKYLQENEIILLKEQKYTDLSFNDILELMTDNLVIISISKDGKFYVLKNQFGPTGRLSSLTLLRLMLQVFVNGLQTNSNMFRAGFKQDLYNSLNEVLRKYNIDELFMD